jgi:hypothetical protein
VNIKAVLAAAVLAVVVTDMPARAQIRLQVHGFVQWISGSKMILMTDQGVSVAVDLTQADQDSYNDVRPADWVTVAGELTRDRSRVIARQIWPDREAGNVLESPF